MSCPKCGRDLEDADMLDGWWGSPERWCESCAAYVIPVLEESPEPEPLGDDG